jgi:hypothetical protein
MGLIQINSYPHRYLQLRTQSPGSPARDEAFVLLSLDFAPRWSGAFNHRPHKKSLHKTIMSCLTLFTFTILDSSLLLYIYGQNNRLLSSFPKVVLEPNKFRQLQKSHHQWISWPGDSCRRRWICCFRDSLTDQIKPRVNDHFQGKMAGPCGQQNLHPSVWYISFEWVMFGWCLGHVWVMFGVMWVMWVNR